MAGDKLEKELHQYPKKLWEEFIDDIGLDLNEQKRYLKIIEQSDLSSNSQICLNLKKRKH